MRQFAALFLSAGVLAAPAFSQYRTTSQHPSLAGKWVKYNVAQDGTTLLRFESVELRQIGNQLAGIETIAERPGRVVVLSLTGQTTGTSGVIRETGVQRLQRFRQPCLLDADFRMTGPDTLVINWQPEIDCGDAGTIVLSREKVQPQTVTRNRQQQNNSLLGALLLGMMGGDSGSSSSSGNSSAEQKDRHEQGCAWGVSSDCASAKQDTIFPDKDQ